MNRHSPRRRGRPYVRSNDASPNPQKGLAVHRREAEFADRREATSAGGESVQAAEDCRFSLQLHAVGIAHTIADGPRQLANLGTRCSPTVR